MSDEQTTGWEFITSAIARGLHRGPDSWDSLASTYRAALLGEAEDLLAAHDVEVAKSALDPVREWVADLRYLHEEHENFTGDRVSLIDESGLHFPLDDELNDLAAQIEGAS